MNLIDHIIEKKLRDIDEQWHKGMSPLEARGLCESEAGDFPVDPKALVVFVIQDPALWAVSPELPQGDYLAPSAGNIVSQAVYERILEECKKHILSKGGQVEDG